MRNAGRSSVLSMMVISVALPLATACEHRTPELEMHESTLPLDGTAHSLGPDIDTHDPGAAMGPLTQPNATAPRSNRCMVQLAAVAPAIPPKASNCPADPLAGKGAAAATALPQGDVEFEGVPGTHVHVEIAVPPDATERGLMFRTKMAEDAGMFFDLQEHKEHQFWMHNTCLPLDLLYIDNDGVLVGVVESAPTLDDTPRSVGCFSSFVLEVNAGWTRRHGVKPGQKLVFPSGAARR